MKITYNKTTQAIEIKDGIKNRYLLYKFLIIINLLNAVLNLFNGIKHEFGTINFLWVILGIIFTYLFYIYFIKKVTAESIPIEEIDALKAKSVFGIKTYYIKLKNEKQRDLIEIKTQVEFDALKNMLPDFKNLK